MSNVKEYYSPTEIKRIDEHKQFTAERYLKATDYNPTAKELPQKGKEFFVQQESTPTKSKPTLGQKLRKQMAKTATKATTSSIATTVAAAVGSVVVLSTMFVPTPTIDLKQLDAGKDYVSYTILAEDLQEDVYYFVEVYNSYDSFTNDIVEGENQHTVEGLREDISYNLEVKGIDEEEQQTTTYFKKTFYTSSNKSPLEQTTFTLADSLTLSGENIYSIDYALLNGTEQDLVLEQMTFYAVFDNQPEQELECYYPALDGTGTFDIEVPWGTTSITLYASANVATIDGVQTYQTPSVTYAIDSTAQLQLLSTKVNVYDYDYNDTTELDLDFAYSAPEGASVIVQDISSADVTDAIYTWYYGTFDITLGQTDNGTLHTFSYYLADSQGNQLTTPQTVTVDSSVTGTWDSFEYRNPGEITKTYVKYGDRYLENLYIDLKFASSDADVYYSITHSARGEYESYVSRNPVAVIENTTESTGLDYTICKDVNGITYVLYKVVPSGDTASEPWFDATVAQQETGYTINVQLPDYIPFERDNIQLRVAYADGTEQTFDIDASQIVADTEYYVYKFSVETQIEPTSIWLSIATAPNYNDYDTISTQIEMVGDPYKYQEYQIYGG